MSDVLEMLKEELNNPEFVKGYGAEVAKNNVGMTLYKIRKQMNLTQKELSDKLGISQPYIAKLESGEANPTVSSVGEILAVLGFMLITDSIPMKSDVNPISFSTSTKKEYKYFPAFALQQGSAEIMAPAVQKQGQEIPCLTSSACYVVGGSL
jgi:transcriptional regulator with XRE-family HTH domain